MKENYIDKALVVKIMKRHRRTKTDYKGLYGHALVMGGRWGKLGAVQFMGQGALRSGVGKLTIFVPECGLIPIQTALPEAMVETDSNLKILTKFPELSHYHAIGIGCGMGMERKTLDMFREFVVKRRQPCVFDADALNLIAENSELMRKLDEDCVLTPHPKEFLRLVEQQYNVQAVIDPKELEKLQVELVHVTNATLVFKSHRTKVITSKGSIFVNTIGTNALATAGTGDLLTGIITGLLAQGYESDEAAIVAVYVHSYAGHLSGIDIGERSTIASDVSKYVGQAFHFLDSK